MALGPTSTCRLPGTRRLPKGGSACQLMRLGGRTASVGTTREVSFANVAARVTISYRPLRGRVKFARYWGERVVSVLTSCSGIDDGHEHTKVGGLLREQVAAR